MLEYCKQIIQYKLSEFKTTIADDYKILDDNTISCSLSTAVIVRLSYKLILNKQLEYLDLCLHLLRKWQNGSI